MYNLFSALKNLVSPPQTQPPTIFELTPLKPRQSDQPRALIHTPSIGPIPTQVQQANPPRAIIYLPLNTLINKPLLSRSLLPFLDHSDTLHLIIALKNKYILGIQFSLKNLLGIEPIVSHRISLDTSRDTNAIETFIQLLQNTPAPELQSQFPSLELDFSKIIDQDTFQRILNLIAEKQINLTKLSTEYNHSNGTLDFKSIPSLTHLSIRGLSGHRSTFEPINLPNLTHLSIRSIGDWVSVTLPELPNLIDLFLGHFYGSGASLNPLPFLPKLTKLSIEFFHKLFFDFNNVPNLTQLNLHYVTKDTTLPILPKLTHLSISCISHHTVLSLPTLPKLTHLNIKGLYSKSTLSLSTLPKLTHFAINLINGEVTISPLPELPSLTHFTMHRIPWHMPLMLPELKHLSIKAIHHLDHTDLRGSQLPKITHLDIGWVSAGSGLSLPSLPITHFSIGQLRADSYTNIAILPNLTHFSVNKFEGAPRLPFLPAFPKLTHLCVGGGYHDIYLLSWMHLELPPLPHLQEIHYYCSDQEKEDGKTIILPDHILAPTNLEELIEEHFPTKPHVTKQRRIPKEEFKDNE